MEERAMLRKDQIEAYRRDGLFVVEGGLSTAEINALREVTDGLVEHARSVAEHNEVYDLEPSHSSEDPRVRRIKTPHLQHPIYDAMMRHDAILRILQQL